MKPLTLKTRKWGNSTGVVLPRELGILPDEEITIHIDSPQKFTKVKDIFGALKLKKSTTQLMREIDEELDSKW